MFGEKKNQKLSGEGKNKNENKKLELDDLDKVTGGGLMDMPTDTPSDISGDTKNKV